MRKKVNYLMFISSLIFISMNDVLAEGINRECVTCGKNALAIPAAIPKFVAAMITLVQIIVPIALIVFTMIRYLKAVASGEDKGFSNANRSFLRNIIAAIVVFLVISLVKTTFNIIEKASEESGTTSCVSCFITGDCSTGTCLDRGNLNESEKNSNSSSGSSSESVKDEGEGCYYCSNSQSYTWKKHTPSSDCKINKKVEKKENCTATWVRRNG